MTLTFAEMEALLGVSLPPSAYTRRWWSNARQMRSSQAWLPPGWRVAHVALSERSVTFVRQPVSE